jgi:2'-5' RNA ligase
VDEDSGYTHVTRAASGGGVGLRLFAAMHVPMAHAQQLADHADVLSATFDVGRACDPATMHLTWAFLGRVAEEHVPAIASALDQAAESVIGPTSCRVEGCGAFGRHRALAAEVDVELLAMLDSARDQFLGATAPYAPEMDHRPWRPHVTILRSRGHEQLPAALLADCSLPAPISWIASELRLYASLPGPAGSQHRVLHAAPLGVPART